MKGMEKVVASIALAPTDEQALAEEVTGIEYQAESLVVGSDEEYEQAAEFGRMLKKKASQVTDFFKPMKDAAYQAHKAVCDREKAMLQPLRTAESTIKKAMGGYIAEKERRRQEQEEAMRRAAKAEAERLLQQATECEKAGDADGTDKALDEAIIMDEAAALEAPMEQKPKAKGVSTSKDWEIVSIDDNKVPDEVAGIVIRPVDKAALMRLIRASKGTAIIPGVCYKEVSKISFSRR